ncbi:MAG: hypothetical protein ACRDQH_05460 [Pseudonocardiaceae bacterium]
MATALVFVALVIGSGFVVLQTTALREEAKIARQERASHPDPDRRRKSARTVAVLVAVYGSLAGAFLIGWRAGGSAAGALSAVAVAVLWVLGAGAFAVRSALVTRK